MTRWIRKALPVAVVVLILALVPRLYDMLVGDGPPPSPESQSRLSAEAPPAKPLRPVIETPRGVVALFPFGSFDEPPPQFIWTRDSTATSYRIEIADESGSLLSSQEVADTTVAWPAASLAQHAGKVLVWRVTPIANQVSGTPSDPQRVFFTTKATRAQ